MLDQLPTVNALLNATSAILLTVGHRMIKRGRQQSHRRYMIAALLVSGLFLISYITYHYHHGATTFQAKGLIRPVYFTILFSHTFLAAAVVPLALITLRRGLRDDIARHKKIARTGQPSGA